jgi:quercetin dioxygenase-like cupin family protein
MSTRFIHLGPGEGRTLLVGGGDYVTYKARTAETDGGYFCFEVSTTPGFGPPLHAHDYRECFYVLEGEYEFTVGENGERSTVTAGAGSFLAVAPNMPHTFRNGADMSARMLFFHQPAGLEEFFEEFGAPVSRVGELPAAIEPPDPAAMAASLERNGIQVLEAPEPVA